MATAPANDERLLLDAIRKALHSEMEASWDSIKQGFIERLDRDKDRIIGGIAIDLMKLVNFETIKENIVITVRKIEQPKP